MFKDCDRLPVLQSKRVFWQKQSGKAQYLGIRMSVRRQAWPRCGLDLSPAWTGGEADQTMWRSGKAKV